MSKTQAELDINKRVNRGEVLTPDTPIVYSNYKEPLSGYVKVDGSNGFGFKGVLAQNKEGTHIQCHECGYFFKSLGSHVAKVHNLSAKEYKKTVGLLAKTSLMAESTRAKYVKQYESKSEEAKEKARKKLLEYQAQNNKKKRQPGNPWSLERRNYDGTCPDQLLEKLRKVSQEIGESPKHDWFKKKYPKYYQAIQTTFGSWSKAKKLAGLEVYTGGQGQILEDGYLLEMLRLHFEKTGKTVVSSDFGRNGLPSIGTYLNRFGTLNNARAAAGIPQTVQLGYGRFITV